MGHVGGTLVAVRCPPFADAYRFVIIFTDIRSWEEDLRFVQFPTELNNTLATGRVGNTRPFCAFDNY